MNMNAAAECKWISDAVFYQIMPDRFCRSGKVPVPEGSELVEWSAVPGKSGRGGREFFGGDLQGILSRLDHIVGTGVNSILLTPVNAAPSYHRYETTDHCMLDPMLGTWRDLEQLIVEVHRRGLRIVCDIALNHVSNQHPWFKAALTGDAEMRRRFTFKEDGSYLCWWGYPGLPELNLSEPAVQDYLFAGKDNVLSFWINKGFDGIRLDCANDLSLPVCHRIAAEFRSRFPDAALIGEVANFSVPWLKALDATQSYFFTASVKACLAGSVNTRQLTRNLQAAYDDGCNNQFLMLSSHDSRRTNTDFKNDRKKITLARRLQFTLPGIPMIYYGEEIGLKGGSDPENRAGMPWDKRTTAASRHYGDEIKALAELRAVSPELRHGVWKPVITDLHPDLFAFFRASEEEPERFTLVTWNNSRSRCAATLTLPWGWLFSETRLHDVFSERFIVASAGMTHVELEAGECVIWQLRDGSKKNYSFFKKFK